MRNSELEEKEKNNCENILHVSKKVVSLHCQTTKEQSKTYRDEKDNRNQLYDEERTQR